MESKIQKARDPINGKSRDRPGGDDPERRPFGGVVVPKVCLSSPRFDRQSATDADEDDEQIGPEIGAGDDRDGYKSEDNDQKPVDVAPPFTIPIDIGKIFFCQRPQM